MDSSRCHFEILNTFPFEIPAVAPSAPLGENGEVWTQLEKKLQTLAAAELSHQFQSASWEPGSKEVIARLVQLFTEHLAETFRQATDALPRSDQQAAARAAICHLFALEPRLGARTGE